MPAFEIISLVVLGALVWFWLDGIKAREIAIRAAQAACAADGLQFLDETVATTRVRPARNDDGQFVLRRVYAFEYSETGSNRRPGSIVMRGQEVELMNVGLRMVSAN